MPHGANIINCHFIFSVKKTKLGTVERFKARLVACGYSQRPGVDYDVSYAPTLRFDTLRIVLALSAGLGLKIFQAGVGAAPLYPGICWYPATL